MNTRNNSKTTTVKEIEVAPPRRSFSPKVNLNGFINHINFFKEFYHRPEPSSKHSSFVKILQLILQHELRSIPCDFNGCSRICRGPDFVAAVVKNTSGRRGDVKKELAVRFIKTMLHACVVAASSAFATITRLTDLLISIEAGRLGFVINHI